MRTGTSPRLRRSQCPRPDPDGHPDRGIPPRRNTDVLTDLQETMLSQPAGPCRSTQGFGLRCPGAALDTGALRPARDEARWRAALDLPRPHAEPARRAVSKHARPRPEVPWSIPRHGARCARLGMRHVGGQRSASPSILTLSRPAGPCRSPHGLGLRCPGASLDTGALRPARDEARWRAALDLPRPHAEPARRAVSKPAGLRPGVPWSLPRHGRAAPGSGWARWRAALDLPIDPHAEPARRAVSKHAGPRPEVPWSLPRHGRAAPGSG